jgi:aryl-alcohol dehydrogenase-like predicted oxidoreductase
MSGVADIERTELAPGYEIPRIVVGLWQLSTGHRAGSSVRRDETAHGLVPLVEAGLNTFDCADIYTGVEEIVGRLAARFAPGEVQVHTKFVPDREALRRIDRRYVERIIDRSLKRVGVERLDLVQFHWWDWAVPGHVETAGWLQELRREGKIRLLGTTNFDAAHLAELREAGIDVVADQVQYSLLDRRPERALAAACRGDGPRMLCYGTLAGGFLTERWRGVAAPPLKWPNRSLEKYALIIEDAGGWQAFQRLLERLHAMALSEDSSLAALATRFVLERPGVAAAIVGARDARRLPDLLETLRVRPSTDDLATMEAMLADLPGPPGDIYELERNLDGRHAAIMRMNLNG